MRERTRLLPLPWCEFGDTSGLAASQPMHGDGWVLLLEGRYRETKWRPARNPPKQGCVPLGMPSDAAREPGQGLEEQSCPGRGWGAVAANATAKLSFPPHRCWSLPVPAPKPILSLLKHCTAFSSHCFLYPTPSTKIAITPPSPPSRGDSGWRAGTHLLLI